jgi:hypothetical protein
MGGEAVRNGDIAAQASRHQFARFLYLPTLAQSNFPQF